MQQARLVQGQAGSKDQGLLTTDEQEELKRLSKENRKLRREKDFLGLRQRQESPGKRETALESLGYCAAPS